MQDKSYTSENDNWGKLQQVTKSAYCIDKHTDRSIGIQIWESNNTFWGKKKTVAERCPKKKKSLCFPFSPKTWLAFNIILH